MEELRSEELAVFLDDLHRRPDGKPSMVLRYAQASGYGKRFSMYFDPFQYEADARGLAPTLPIAKSILAVVLPTDQFSARLYQLKRNTTEPKLRFDRSELLKMAGHHRGFHGLPNDPVLELEYLQDPAAQKKFEQALTLVAATALYRALGSRVDLYFMEKGWNHAYLLTPAWPPIRTCCYQEAVSNIHGA